LLKQLEADFNHRLLSGSSVLGSCTLDGFPIGCGIAAHLLDIGVAVIDLGPDWKYIGDTAYGTNCYSHVSDHVVCLGSTVNSGGNSTGPSNKNCGAGQSTQTTTIVSGNVTTSAPTTALGAFIGGLFGGPPGAALGGAIGSYFGVGVTGSWVPSTNSLYVGPTLVVGIVPGGGSGYSANAVTVPSTQNPNSIANGLSFSVTYQPFFSAGGTVTKSPGSGPAVAGYSTGSRIPASGGASFNICVHNCGC